MICYAKQEINDFLSQNALYIVLGFIGLIIVAIVLLLIFNRKKNKNPKFIKNVEDNFYTYLGGVDNVIEAKLNGSRFVIVLKDNTKFDKEKIKTLGVNNIISLDSIIILLCFIALGCITTFLYLFIFSLVFPCSTLGMKIFFLRFVKDDKSVLKRRILAKRYFILVLLFIFTLGLSLLSDIISIVLSEKGRTFSDQYFGLEVERLTLRKEY